MDDLVQRLSLAEFVLPLISGTGRLLNIKDPLKYPAQFYAETPRRAVNRQGGLSVTVWVTGSGVTRNCVDSKRFCDALEGIVALYVEVIEKHVDLGQRVQLFVVMEIDPGTRNEHVLSIGELESEPVSVTGQKPTQGVLDDPNQDGERGMAPLRTREGCGD